MEYSRLFKE